MNEIEEESAFWAAADLIFLGVMAWQTWKWITK